MGFMVFGFPTALVSARSAWYLCLILSVASCATLACCGWRSQSERGAVAVGASERRLESRLETCTRKFERVRDAA